MSLFTNLENNIKIEGSSENEFFGSSVSMSSDGNTMAIGGYGYGTDKGIVKVYKKK